MYSSIASQNPRSVPVPYNRDTMQTTFPSWTLEQDFSGTDECLPRGNSQKGEGCLQTSDQSRELGRRNCHSEQEREKENEEVGQVMPHELKCSQLWWKETKRNNKNSVRRSRKCSVTLKSSSCGSVCNFHVLDRHHLWHALQWPLSLPSYKQLLALILETIEALKTLAIFFIRTFIHVAIHFSPITKGVKSCRINLKFFLFILIKWVQLLFYRKQNWFVLFLQGKHLFLKQSKYGDSSLIILRLYCRC